MSKIRRCGIYLKIYSNSDTGLIREQNEDTIMFNEDISLCILADGMGGHQAGEVASQMACDIISEHIIETMPNLDLNLDLDDKGISELEENLQEIVTEAFEKANTAIFERGQADSSLEKMGTTLNVLLIKENFAIIGHIGDSRIYKMRSDDLQLETQDHSFVNDQLREKLITEEEARNSIFRNMVTRAMGVRPKMEPEVKIINVQENDIFLLCSDGLTDLIIDEAIQRIVIANKDDLQKGSQHLVDAANRMGGTDNISVILAKVLLQDDHNSLQFNKTDQFKPITD